MVVAWTMCWARAVRWSARGDHGLEAPVQKARNGDRRDAICACQFQP